ncbi:MAG: MFS transporter [Rhodospirillales bacterium]
MPENSNTAGTSVDGSSSAFWLYDLATGDDDARLCRDIPDEQCREQPKSFLSQVVALTLSKTGDAVADTKIVLPWLLGAVGAPAFLVGFLVPIRESLALLPQVLVGVFIRRFPVRKAFWSVSSMVQGTCVILMGIAAFSGLRGATAGWTIVGLLVVFSLARGIASIAAKDTLGKTVSKGRRGRVNGYAATASGLAAVAVGVYLALSPSDRPDWLLYTVIVAAGVSWLLAAGVFARIEEHPGATEGGRGVGDLLRNQVMLMARDKELQKFLLARAMLISTALAGPVYVGLAQREIGQAIDALGLLMIAAGLANAVSSSVWGIFSDRSSRMTMASGGLLAGALGGAVVAGLEVLPGATESIAFYAGVFFILGIAHAGVRIGRKTHVVDLAGAENKAEYVALSNTLIGILLLVMGALTGVLLTIGLEFTVIALSGFSVLGALMAARMQNAQA